MNEGLCDYEGSTFRTVLTWTAYPIGVLLPFGLAIYFRPEEANATYPAFFLLLAFAIAFTFEKIQPHCKRWSRDHDGDTKTSLFHIFLTTTLTQAVTPFVMMGIFWLLNSGDGSSLALVSWPNEWPIMAQAALALVVAEFGVYWEHRLFHTQHYLWRMHAVHHCVRRLTFLNALQSHFLDLVCVGTAIALGLTIFGAPQEMAMLVGIFTVLHGKWQHGNIRYKLGWMNYIFSAVELHRWHHSVRYQDADTNFGSNLIVWDLVFGTYNLPKDRELDVVNGIGLGRDDATFPKTWRGQLIVPLFWNRMVGKRHFYPEQKKKIEEKAKAASAN